MLKHIVTHKKTLRRSRGDSIKPRQLVETECIAIVVATTDDNLTLGLPCSIGDNSIKEGTLATLRVADKGNGYLDILLR